MEKNPSRFEFSGMTLNVAKRELRRDGQVISMAPQSFNLLVFLIVLGVNLQNAFDM